MMINKIITFLIVPCMLLALSLSLAGVQHVDMGKPFISFLQQCSLDLQEFKIEIPQIPKMQKYEDPSILGQFLNNDVTQNIGNTFVFILNLVVTILNTLIQLLEFIIIFIRNVITMRDSLIENSSSVVQQLIIV